MAIEIVVVLAVVMMVLFLVIGFFLAGFGEGSGEILDIQQQSVDVSQQIDIVGSITRISSLYEGEETEEENGEGT